MELSGTTLILEIINFLILVWLLKHFFYKPVMTFLEKRRADVEESLNQAEERHQQAQELEADYQYKLAQWQQEQQAAHQTLQQELQQQRQQALEKLRVSLEQEREKNAAIEQREQTNWQRLQRRHAHEQAMSFVSAMLSSLSSPALEQLLIDHAIEQLENLPPEEKEAFIHAIRQPSSTLKIVSQYKLKKQQEDELRRLFECWSQQPVDIVFDQNETLLSGLVIESGAWILRLNLRDELQGFSEIAYESMD